MGEKMLSCGQNPESHILGDLGAFLRFQHEAVLPGSGQNHLPPAVLWVRAWQSLIAQNSPWLPEQCQEMALWGWARLISIISVSSLDFGNRVVVVLQEIL